MRVILINPTWKETYGEFKDSAKTLVNFPPTGLCYLSGVLKKAGHECEIIDCDVEDMNEDEVVGHIIKTSPGLVGFTAATTVFHRAKEMAAKIKARKDIPTVVGGPHLSLLRTKAMEDGKAFDYGVFGEGEASLLELVETMESGGEMAKVKGIIYRKDGLPVANGTRPYVMDLDSLPFPDFGALKLERYYTHVPGRGIVPCVPVVTSRGCPFGCIYCSAEGILGKKIRYRSIENVLEEFEHIIKAFNVKHMMFIDETLTLNKERLTQLCETVIEKKMGITMEGWTRPEAVNEEIVTIMQKSGFVSLSFGIESGDPDIAKVLGRYTKQDVLVKAFDMAKGAGLETKGYLMIGNPYDTKQTVKNSFDFVCGLKNCDQIFINISTPFPGTKLYDMAKSGEGGLKMLTEDYSQFRKYGNAVITVNDLSRDDLIRLQKRGFLRFYMNPRRFVYNLKRAGFKAAMISGMAFLKSIVAHSESK